MSRRAWYVINTPYHNCIPTYAMPGSYLNRCLNNTRHIQPLILVHSVATDGFDWYNHHAMKKSIHPTYHTNVKVTCSCGNTFITGSTVEQITTELCSKCHPFYTGEQKIVDTANLVSKFEKRKKLAAAKVISKREKQAQRKVARSAQSSSSSPASEKTLKDMLKSLSK